MGKLTLFIATSLDGFIAEEDESLEWLLNVEGEGDNGYLEFYETVDSIFMGRKTYDWIMKHEPNHFPYPDKACYVFSRTLTLHDNNNVQLINDNIVEFTDHLKSNNRNIWLVGGGKLLQVFLNEKLVDEVILTIAPVLLGKGIRLFNEGDYFTNLYLKGSRRFNQFVELHYIVKNSSSEIEVK